MSDRREEIEQLSDEAQAELKKQRSTNRVFGLLVGVAVLFVVILIYELVVLATK